MASRAGNRSPYPDDIADAVLAASNLLLQLSVQCLDSLEPDVNLSEFRVLDVLSVRGPQRLIDIAALLGVTPTTATRLADRLAAHGLVDRVRQSRDRREIHLAISTAGLSLVAAVRAHRRRFVVSALEDLASRDQEVALSLLTRLAGSDRVGQKESA